MVSLQEESLHPVFGTRLRELLPEVDTGLSWLEWLRLGLFLLRFRFDRVSGLEQIARESGPSLELRSRIGLEVGRVDSFLIIIFA